MRPEHLCAGVQNCSSHSGRSPGFASLWRRIHSGATARDSHPLPYSLAARPNEEINHEETKKTKGKQKRIFVFFVSSWLIFFRGGDKHLKALTKNHIKFAAGLKIKASTRSESRSIEAESKKALEPPPAKV
jgi:hypothetical protein